MRVLAAILMLFAGAASAQQDCAERPNFQPSQLVAYEPLGREDMPPVETSGDAERGTEVLVSVRPELRPCKFRRIALEREKKSKRGAVCGDWTILGETLKPIGGKYRGCGIASPVRVHMVSGIGLGQLALMDCETAVTLKTWIEVIAKPAFADQGDGLIGLQMVGHYSCKTQNNQPGARLSEHARGRAVDIAAFVLKDGTVVSVDDGWDAETSGDVLRSLHSGACGMFGTVLGPEADQYHKGHFHFDTARRRSGAVCR